MGHDGVAMTMNRRALIRGSLAAALSLAAASRQSFAFAAQGSADAPPASPLQPLAMDHLRRSPEEATAQDFDTGAHGNLRRLLDDRSLDSIAAFRKATEQALAELARIDRASLSAPAKLDLDVATFVYDTLKETLSYYGFV